MKTFQEIIMKLQSYWSYCGCQLLQPIDMQVGAGTFHPATFLKSLGPEPWSCCYVQASRRPTDGRYGDNPNRLQHYYQFQTVIKPSPSNLQELYIDSLSALGINAQEHDIRFVEDNWKSPTLGAWGLGWEVWLNGMEISQITYFQEAAGIKCEPILAEITYGLERMAMYIQEKDNVYDIIWNQTKDHVITYGDIWHENEVQHSAYNFTFANSDFLLQLFNQLEGEVNYLVEQNLALPAYELVLQCSHTFNILDARQAISNTERIEYIRRIRHLSKRAAECYLEQRRNKNFPLLNK